MQRCHQPVPTQPIYRYHIFVGGGSPKARAASIGTLGRIMIAERKMHADDEKITWPINYRKGADVTEQVPKTTPHTDKRDSLRRCHTFDIALRSTLSGTMRCCCNERHELRVTTLYPERSLNQ